MATQDKYYTVFAVYEENLQPYCTSVWANDPEEAVQAAQVQCAADNDPNGEYPEPDPVRDCAGAGYVEALGDYGDYTLTAYQVVKGEVEVVL